MSACSDATGPGVAQEPPAQPPSSSADDGAAETTIAGDDVVAVLRLARSAHQYGRADLLELPRVERARLVAPCAPLSWGDVYCLGLGFRVERPDYRELLAPVPGTATGDLAFRRWVAQRVAMPRGRRLALQRAEATTAISGLDKARSLSSGGARSPASGHR